MLLGDAGRSSRPPASTVPIVEDTTYEGAPADEKKRNIHRHTYHDINFNYVTFTKARMAF